MIEKDYEAFFLPGKPQVEDTVLGPIYTPSEDVLIMGVYVQAQTDEVVNASALDIVSGGRFITHPDSPVDGKDILRRGRDNERVELIGVPVVSPKRGRVRVKIFKARFTAER